MKKLTTIAALALATLLPHWRIAGNATATLTYEFTGGRWFDGQKFTSKTFYSASGVLTSRKPARVDSVVDLAGKYVVPPYGEAHNHNVESSRVDAVIKMYLAAGIFYVKNPNSLPRFTTPLLDKVNIATSIDVVFANGGLTGSGGHPAGLVRRNIERKIWTEADGEGAFLFTIDTLADLDDKWQKIKAGKPDFIKTYLLYSEEYAKRRSDDSYLDWRGLDPALLPAIVKRAHRDGLRVSTHVESAVDFHNAVAAGVDEINHLPGFRPDRNDQKAYQDASRYEIAGADAGLAAKKGIFVVTTLGPLIEALNRVDANSPQGADANRVKELLVRNLRLLHGSGVRLAIGSDSYRQTSAYEARNLHSLKAFDSLTLLKLWCENTAATIFPKRKIGLLKDGYEASFLALEGDPITDFANAEKVAMRVKQGVILP